MGFSHLKGELLHSEGRWHGASLPDQTPPLSGSAAAPHTSSICISILYNHTSELSLVSRYQINIPKQYPHISCYCQLPPASNNQIKKDEKFSSQMVDSYFIKKLIIHSYPWNMIIA